MLLQTTAPLKSEEILIDAASYRSTGTSSAVSPLMEKKCGDRQALPSVFGRTDDAMGNSVPGFGGPSPSALRAELDAQAYFRSNSDRK